MSVGEKIKRIRKFRGLTQRELGSRIGFDDNTADVRIAQYESGTRRPKDDLLKKIAAALNVSYRSLCEPCSYSEEDVMYLLFELEEHYMTQIWNLPELDESFNINHAVQIRSPQLEKYITEWKREREKLAHGIISRSEYMEWKLNVTFGK